MKILNVTLQFQFDTSGATTVVSVLSTLVKVTEAWTCPLKQWSTYEQVSVQVQSLQPPADLAYSLLINGERQSIQGDYFRCVLGLLAEGTTFAVEAIHQGHTHRLAVNFAPEIGHSDPRKKVPIIIKATTEPPPTTPIGFEVDDLVSLPQLEKLLKEIRDRLTFVGADQTSLGPVTDMLRSAKGLTHRLTNFFGPDRNGSHVAGAEVDAVGDRADGVQPGPERPIF